MQNSLPLDAISAQNPWVSLPALRGQSAQRPVLTGFAPAATLHALSFPDVLDERTGRGYQRPFSPQHSLDFRRYIHLDGSATIPLTFNLRPDTQGSWRVVGDEGLVRLELSAVAGKPLAQVDCQHRLGHLADSGIELPFMTFIGLNQREELEIFSVINSKAKGLSSSLLDYHDAQLARDLGKERPELLIALQLNQAANSPWYQQLDLGGTATSGMTRLASLRTMQKAVRRFLSATGILEELEPTQVALVVLDFWWAVATVLHNEWANPRRHFLTKGIGVYALMGLLADFWKEGLPPSADLRRQRLAALFSDFAPSFDWSNQGPLKGLGGESGADQALDLLRAARAQSTRHLKLIQHG